MLRRIVVAGCLLILLMTGACKTGQRECEQGREQDHSIVDVDVSGHRVDVRVKPEQSDDVDVRVTWP